MYQGHPQCYQLDGHQSSVWNIDRNYHGEHVIWLFNSFHQNTALGLK